MPSTAYITRNEAAEVSGASSAVINKAIEQKAVRGRRRAGTAGAAIDARDVGALVVFADLDFGLPVRIKRRIAAWLRDAETGAEFPLSASVVVRKSPEIEAAISRSLRYVDLRDRFLEVDPDRQGGEPVIRGTRVPIRGLAKQIEAGESMDVLREEYDYIDVDAFEFAVLWAKANPRRGRPSSASRSPEDREPPLRRRELLDTRRAAGHSA